MSEAQSRQTRVGHVYDDSEAVDVYVGRGSGKRSMGEVPIGKRGWLGNPHTVASYGRENCIEMFRVDFEERLRSDEEFREAVRELAGQTLGCYCQRLEDDEPACHGEVIAEWADRLDEEDGEMPEDEDRLPMIPWCRDCWDKIGEADTEPPEECPECGSERTFKI